MEDYCVPRTYNTSEAFDTKSIFHAFMDLLGEMNVS